LFAKWASGRLLFSAMKRVFFLSVAVALLAPALARAGDVTMVARDVPLGERALQSAAAPIHFNLLGLHWKGAGLVEYRTRPAGGPWSEWRAADADTGPDAGSAEGARQRGWHDGNLDWTGASSQVQFRRRGAVTRLRAYYLWSKPKRLPTRSLSIAGSPSIVTRALWQADEKIKRAKPEYAKSLKLAVVHHTAGSNAYTPQEAAAIVRGIEVYHVKGNGWNDIGYNFLVDRYGTVYEGRAGGIERNVIGAHSLGFNAGTVGVAMIGNFAKASPPRAAEDALVRLLAWRLDVAHVDPLSSVVDTSAGNERYRAGKVVTLRAISAHRDTGPTECPGNTAYALLPGLTRRVASTGLPKLYSVVASGALGGPVRFQGRLSRQLRWTVTVTSTAGTVVARRSGSSSIVDWSWDSSRAGKGPFRWRMDAGRDVLPAEGVVGVPVVTAPKPATPKPTPAPAPVTPVTPAPVPPVTPVPSVVSGLTVSPSTLTPAADNTGVAASVSFTLTTSAQVTATVTAISGGPALLTLLSASLPAGSATYQWNLGILANGRYRLNVAAQPSAGAASTQSVDGVVDRTLGGFSGLPGAFSPNGDGVNDTISFSFLATQPASVLLSVQRAGVTVATVWSAQVAPGMQVVGWDGNVNGTRLVDGDYVAVLTATTSLGTVSLLQAIVIDTIPPALTLLDGPGLRLDLNEGATVSAVVNGQSIVLSQPRGQFAVPFTAGPVTSFTVQARDTAGNLGPVVTWP
jgi:hypothetical protein